MFVRKVGRKTKLGGTAVAIIVPKSKIGSLGFILYFFKESGYAPRNPLQNLFIRGGTAETMDQRTRVYEK
jgi:hypothetical protein